MHWFALSPRSPICKEGSSREALRANEARALWLSDTPGAGMVVDTATSPAVAVEVLGHSFTPSLPAANSIRWAANAFAVAAAVSALFPRVMTRRGKSADIPSAWAARGGALARHSTRPDLAAGACHPGSLPPPLLLQIFHACPLESATVTNGTTAH